MTPSSSPERLLRYGRLLLGSVFVLTIGYFFAFKTGLLPARPALFAALVGGCALGVVSWGIAAVIQLARGRRRVSAAAELAAVVGLLLVAGAGLANWAFSLQGYVLVPEKEPVRLRSPGEWGTFEAGPLADLGELDVTIALARLRLEAAGPELFRAVSFLKLLDADGEEVGLSVSRGTPALRRSLVFRQGAFGFAPRVSVKKDGRELLGTFVPFRTMREGAGGIAFVGEFEIAAEKLSFRGAVQLDDLNDAMKGHPSLELAIRNESGPLGSGELRPGEFVDLEGGYRVGFSGLQRWTEIDFARRTYSTPMLAGAALFLLALVARAIAGWRRA